MGALFLLWFFFGRLFLVAIDLTIISFYFFLFIVFLLPSDDDEHEWEDDEHLHSVKPHELHHV